MTTYYVGITAAGNEDGTTWADRLGTLNDAENIPVAANDTVYVGPGTYRETLTVDVAGTAGNPITYIGDVDGSHTDGVGGIVRITGSNNDTTATRANCIIGAFAYRTFRGLSLDLGLANALIYAKEDHWIIEDCNLSHSAFGVYSEQTATTDIIIRRCNFFNLTTAAIKFWAGAQLAGTNHLIENCLFLGCDTGLLDTRVEGITIKDCTFIGSGYSCIDAPTTTAAAQITVNNCIFCANDKVFNAGADTTQIVENYNALFGNNTARVNTNTGANSNAYPPLFNPATLLSGYRYPWNFPELAPYSPLRAIAGTGEATDDLFGRARPATAAKNSWGAVQFSDTLRETTTKRTGTASIKFEDAGRHQIWVPTTNVSTTISVYVYYEEDYAGTLPQMIIKQPGVANRTTVATVAGKEDWELLTDTFTPAASPGYCVVELVSNNTAAYSATVQCMFDDLVVS